MAARRGKNEARAACSFVLCSSFNFAVASEADGPLGASGRRGRALLSPPLAASL